ncbi:hypothetical protein N7490_009656 [Penicillium lividum]|nr:hypothetical protein N7490_009656 [Penicillium lividum]
MDEPKSESAGLAASSSEPPNPIPVIDAADQHAISEEILRHQAVLVMLVEMEGSLLVNKIHEMNQGPIATTVSDLLGLIKEELNALNQKMKILRTIIGD